MILKELYLNIYEHAFFREVKQHQDQEILQLETHILGLGPRYFFNHYPGHWLPSSVSITQGVTTTALPYP